VSTSPNPAQRRTPTPAADGAPAADPSRWLPRLRQALDEHLEAARHLHRLSEAQGLAVRAGDAEEILRLLREREPVVATLATINDTLAPLAETFAAAGGHVEPAERHRITAELEELDQLIARVAARDAEDRSALERLRTALGEQLSALGARRGAVNAYAGAPSARQDSPSGLQAPGFQDRLG
jgi:flagellar biosynthesis/type III secretory pathway chaperone